MKKIYLITVLFTSLYSFAQLQGQPKIDSLNIELKKNIDKKTKVNILNDLSQEFVNIDPSQGFKYAEESKNLATKINYNKGLGDAYRCLANNSEGKKTFEYLDKALEIAKKNKNLKLEGAIYSNLAVYYTYESKYDKALIYNFKALKIWEFQKNALSIAGTYLNIGYLYRDLQQLEKALFYFNKALNKNKEFDNQLMRAVIMDNISTVYQDKKEFTKAIPITSESLRIFRKLNNLNYVSTSLASLAFSNYHLKNYDLSEKLSLEAIEICKKTGVNRALSASLSNLSSVYLIKFNDKNSLNYYKNNDYLKKVISQQILSIETDKEVDDLRAMSENYKILSNAYELFNDNKNALINQRLYTKYKDSVFNSENKETIKNLEDKREIELRDKEIKINKLSLETKEKQKWLFVVGIGFLAIIGGLLFYQSRKRKLTNLKLETLNKNLDQNNLKLENLNKDLEQANKAKTRFFGILNHDLRGPVSNLVIFLQLQQDAPEMLDAESTKRMQEKTKVGAENLLASMEDILQWSKSQMDNFKPQPKNVIVNQLFDDTKKVFSGYLNIKIEYQNPENIEIFTDDNYLKTIIRNLTSNAINIFTDIENPTIIWKAWQQDKISYLSITDNGSGANPEKLKALFEESELGSTKSGLGLHLIRDMAKAIDCEISVESTIGIGTTFTLKI
jgi:signal transduction histidine kinase